MKLLSTFVIFASVFGFVASTLWAEVRLKAYGVPYEKRLFSLNGLTSVARIFFYVGEHDRYRDVHVAIHCARIFLVIFFVSLLIKVIIVGL